MKRQEQRNRGEAGRVFCAASGHDGGNMRTMRIATCTKRHVLPDGSLTLLGAVEAVTPTMTLVELGGTRLLVDVGTERFGDRLPPEALQVETLLLTHGHNDHVSGLERLVVEGRVREVVATAPTLEIAKLQVKDGIKLARRDREEYDAFVARFDRVARPVGYREPIRYGDVSVRFHDAGHLLGSASIELVSPKSRLIVSGDLGRPGSPILRDYNTAWDADRPVDLVLMETTYGGRDQPAQAADLADRLEAAIKHALRDGGHILVPTFAIGRAQVLLYLLNELVEAGRIPELPVAVDTPMGLTVTDTYRRFRKLYDRESVAKLERGDDPIDFEGLYAVREASQSRRLDELTQPVLILAGSGMCTGGRIVGHLKHLLPRPETDVIFVGYQAENTPGARIQRMGEERSGAGGPPPTIWLDGEEIAVRANITTLAGISAHADRGELLQWLRAIPGVATLALHHGDRQAQEAFRQWAAPQLTGG
jgi:metallo-beta-lactamase family protein